VNRSTDVSDWLMRWFEANTTATRQELNNSHDANYFEKRWMDSLKFVVFIMDVEARFNISFSNEEFQNRDFSTIDGLKKIIINHIESLHE
jgi:acyl carrier protein